MDKNSFIELVRVHLSCYNMKLVIAKKAFVKTDDNTEVGGYFCDGDGRIVVAGENTKWFGILVHEYCHFLQWEENYPGYANYDRHYSGWDSWLNKRRNLKKRDLHTKFLAIRNLELDCEKRVIKLIKKYKLPINIPKYIQGANAYMFFHAYIKKYRFWPNVDIESKLKDIQPKRFLKEHRYNRMSKKFEDIMNALCE